MRADGGSPLFRRSLYTTICLIIGAEGSVGPFEPSASITPKLCNNTSALSGAVGLAKDLGGQCVFGPTTKMGASHDLYW